MSDDESCYSADERKAKGGIKLFKPRERIMTKEMAELDETLAVYIEEWRTRRQKELDELEKLKEKQAKRKVIRAEEEKKLQESQRQEEERKMKEENEARLRDQEEKRKKLEEAEKKRQAAQQKQKENKSKQVKKRANSGRLGSMNSQQKSKEQLEQEKNIAMSVRVPPLMGADDMNSETLLSKVTELWKLIVKKETEKYDLEQKDKRQTYDLTELRERRKQQLRQKALKKGLEPEALTGKHPPKIQTASKFERRPDSKTYDDKKKLFEGGWEVVQSEEIERLFNEKIDEWQNRNKSKLPKWFGERPGAKGPSESDEEPEDEEDPEPPQPDYDDEEEEEEEEEESEEEESEEEEE